MTNERNGKIVGAVQVQNEDEIMMITNNGTLVRIAVGDISEMGRNTQGVRLIRLTKGEKLVEVEKIEVLAGVEGAEEGFPEDIGALPDVDAGSAEDETPE